MKHLQIQSTPFCWGNPRDVPEHVSFSGRGTVDVVKRSPTPVRNDERRGCPRENVVEGFTTQWS